MLIREAIARGVADLKLADIKSPQLDASLLLAHILNTNRTTLIAAGSETLSQEAYQTFCSLIKRRCNGECVAYIIGKKEFMGLEFAVNPFVLVPRPDTEILVEAALFILLQQAITTQNEFKILDLCTGSGAVAISLKHEKPELDVYVIDICADALETAKGNAAKLLPGSNIQFYQGDLYNALPKSQFSTFNFQLIVSNPPYIPSDDISKLSIEIQREPRIALDGGSSGLDVIKRIIDGAPDFLQQGGFLLMEADPGLMLEINILLEQRGFIDIQLFNDLSGSQRVIGGKIDK